MNSKLLRSELKSIVKECLVEILSEGLLNTNVANKKSIKENRDMNTENKRKKHLDNIKFTKKKNINTNITNDPILNEILADTANTTLGSQAAAEKRNISNDLVIMQGDDAAKIVDQSSPEELFSEHADKWASLAFS